MSRKRRVGAGVLRELPRWTEARVVARRSTHLSAGIMPDIPATSVRDIRFLLVIALCLGVFTVSWPRPPQGRAATSATVPADFVKDPIAYYFTERYSEALRYGATLISDPVTPPLVRAEAILTTATIHLAQRRESKARQAIMQILSEDPSAELTDPDRFPAPVTRLFYRMRDSVCTAQLQYLVEQKKLLSSITTIAIGDIENNSIVTSKYNLDHLCRGLAHILANDLREATSLKVVDRQRLSVLLDEIGLSKQSGIVNPQTRVRVGQLTGAQSFLFGQFMQIDEKTARMDLRWVNTATGEHLLSDAVQAKVETAEDIFQLERKLLLEVLAPRIQKLLETPQGSGDLQQKMKQLLDDRRRAMPKKNSYGSWLEASGKARAQEDAGEMDAAIATWNQAYALNPADSTAMLRAKTMAAYRKAGSSKS
jgi:curli biogenesis system outer membrane secretion channel CsgG